MDQVPSMSKGQLDAGAVGASVGPPPFRYCMPTHAVYTPPVPTARTLLFLLSILYKSVTQLLFNMILAR